MELLLVGVGSDENVLKSTTVKFAQFQYTKSHWTVSFEWINSIVHEFYLIKQLQKKQNKTKQKKNRKALAEKVKKRIGFPCQAGTSAQWPLLGPRWENAS